MGLLDIERSPYVSEMAYFSSAPNVAGMMTEDGRVILRPELQGKSRDAVRLNEASRLALQNYLPSSLLTNEQQAMFRGTPYGMDATNGIRSIIARGLSGDPSAMLSFEQDAELRKLTALGGLLGGVGR